MAEIVEWLSPVAAAISVRDGWPARRTAAMTIARLRRRRSSWRIPADIALTLLSCTLRLTKQPRMRLAKSFFFEPKDLAEAWN